MALSRALVAKRTRGREELTFGEAGGNVGLKRGLGGFTRSSSSEASANGGEVARLVDEGVGRESVVGIRERPVDGQDVG